MLDKFFAICYTNPVALLGLYLFVRSGGKKRGACKEKEMKGDCRNANL